MRSLKVMLVAALVLSMGVAAYADLQTVTTSGSLRIRGNMYDMENFGQTGTSAESSWVEMRTRLGVQADFTDNVSALIELDSYNNWGDSFRSNWVTGADVAGFDTVQLYQAYIQASEMWGTPLQLRIGRQELSFGSEWLVGVNDAAAVFTGLSFDGVRATYATDMFSVDAFWTKLNENFRDFGDSDTDFYGIYASYLGIEDMVIDAYWLYVREDNSDATLIAPINPAGIFFGSGRGDDADLHTIGLRGAGTFGAFDYEAEIALQFGNVEMPQSLLQRFFGIDNDFDYGEFATNLEVGYTFDMEYTPRVFLGFAYFGGGDAGDNGGIFRRAGRDLAFNRLFSNWEYTEFFANTDESNMFIYRGGVSAAPTESLELSLLLSYFVADDTLDRPGVLADLFGWNNNDDNLGLELGLYASYAYSSDLTFNAGWAHFFADDGVGNMPNWLGFNGRQGNPVRLNGLGLASADNGDDWDYLFIESEIKF